MNANDFLQCRAPDELIAGILHWGAGCWHRTSGGIPDTALCPHCDHSKAYPPPSKRKLRLVACAYCRLAWQHLTESARRGVLVAERFAEGQSLLTELTSTYVQTSCPLASAALLRQETDAARVAVERVWQLLRGQLRAHTRQELDLLIFQRDAELCDVIRDVIGHPIRPPAVDPAWLDANGGQVLAVAACIDLEGRFDELPVLADALEEAGCADAGLLEHARQPKHYRGCWLLDAVLGKS
jgi:hypothetical protein